MVLLKGIQKKARSTKSPATQSRTIQLQATQSPLAKSLSAQPRPARRIKAAAQTNPHGDPSRDMRSGSVSLFLLMPDESKQKDSTGSSLLDSLAKSHTHEAAALRNLGLIKVSTPKEAPTPQQVDRSITHAESQPTAKRRELSGGIKSEVESRQKSKLNSNIGNSSTDSQSENRVESKPENRAATNNKPAKVRTTPQSTEVAAEATTRTAAKTQPAQASQHSQSPAPSNSGKTAHPVSDGKAARASAASVGLLDIDDTLLFGGAHGEISLADPYVEQLEDSPVYILAYLGQQVSAFTVTQLQNGFPNNADPNVINRPDSPKYHTVLEINSFQLSELDSRGKVAARSTQPMQPSTKQALEEHSNTSELDGLNAQIQDLNAQLEYLRSKLDQAISI